MLTGPFFFARLNTASGNETDLFHFIKTRLMVPLMLFAVMYLLSVIMEEFVFASTGPGPEALNIILSIIITILLIKSDRVTRNLYINLVPALGLLMIVVHTYCSQSGFNSGIYPFLGLIIHVVSVAIWLGGLGILLALYLFGSGSIEPLANQYKKHLEYRFFQTTLILLLLSLVSGAILMTSNVHDFAVMDFTRYGRYLSIKLYLVAAIIIFILLEITRLKSLFVPAEADQKANLKTNTIPANIIKSILLVFILLCSGILTRIDPPKIAPFINPQTWQLSVEGQNVQIDMQPVAGSTIDIRFEVFLPETLMQMQPLNMEFDLYASDTDAGTYHGEVIQVSQNSFQGEATLPAPGNWQLVLNVNMADGAMLSGNQSFVVPSQPLVEDVRTYLSISAITYSHSNIIKFLVGIGLVLVYGWMVRRGFSRQVSSLLVLVGLAGFALGISFLISVTLVRTYPSTYWKNPQTYSSDSINQGRIKYIEHCSECHGDNGAGDGGWAIDNRGRIPDLASQHMDVHTDGELYWWNARGISSLEMPPFENEISDTDNWNIIYYIRSLRHGVP